MGSSFMVFQFGESNFKIADRHVLDGHRVVRHQPAFLQPIHQQEMRFAARQAAQISDEF